jgi:hypothetical protein
MPWLKDPRKVNRAVFVLLTLGAALRIVQYLARTSLWGDELAVVSNVLSRSPASLVTQPLSSFQIAPSGFLLLVKLTITLIGANEYSFRLVPLLASLLALPLFVSVARKCLPLEAALLALAAFAMSPPLIRYGAQVKPYSSDVAVCLFCLSLTLSWVAAPSFRSTLLVAGAGAVMIWFSYPLVFVLTPAALLVLAGYRLPASPVSRKRCVVVFAAWLASAAPLAIIEHHRLSRDTQSYMSAFWADWMLLHNGGFHHMGTYLWQITDDLLSNFLHLPKWPLAFGLLLVGTYYLMRQQIRVTLAVLGPVLFALGASMVGMYPFRGRLILFLVPNLLLLLAAGVLTATGIAAKLGLSPRMEQALFFLATLVICVRPLQKAPPPYYDSETKPVISYLGSHRRDGDAIYVHNMAWRQFVFMGYLLDAGSPNM